MARFVLNQPITTAEPVIAVDAGLPLGRHRFRLEVVDARGRRSAPDETIVEVQRIVVPPIQPPVVPPGPGPVPVIRTSRTGPSRRPRSER